MTFIIFIFFLCKTGYDQLGSSCNKYITSGFQIVGMRCPKGLYIYIYIIKSPQKVELKGDTASYPALFSIWFSFFVFL